MKVLTRLSRRILLRRVLFCLLLYALLAIGLFRYASMYEIHFFPESLTLKLLVPRVIIYVIILLTPLLVCRVLEAAFDKKWEGVIVSRTVQRRFLMSVTNRRMREVDVEVITVQCDGGKKRKFEFWDDKIKYSHYFAIGDRVRHYRCLKFPEKVDKSADELKFCCKCGATHHKEQASCYFCGAPLVGADEDQTTEKAVFSRPEMFDR